MNRIQKTFSSAKEQGRSVFVAYLTVGCPTLEGTLKAIDKLVEGGADVIELGIPFSDPFADGAVIRSAAYKAIAQGVDMDAVLSVATEARRRHPETPFVAFGYYNMIFSYGNEKFAGKAAAAGIDAVLAVDLPLEERGELVPVLKKHGLAFIPLIAPNTPMERVRRSAEEMEDGFLYAMTVKGVTGVRGSLPDDVADRLDAIRRETGMSVVAGFGISSRAQGEALVKGHADGYVIGSAIVKKLCEEGWEKAESLV